MLTRRRFIYLSGVSAAGVLLASCATPPATSSPSPATVTPEPTATQDSTSTPSPTATNRPTLTPSPTSTEVPTSTATPVLLPSRWNEAQILEKYEGYLTDNSNPAYKTLKKYLDGAVVINCSDHPHKLTTSTGFRLPDNLFVKEGLVSGEVIKTVALIGVEEVQVKETSVTELVGILAALRDNDDIDPNADPHDLRTQLRLVGAGLGSSDGDKLGQTYVVNLDSSVKDSDGSIDQSKLRKKFKTLKELNRYYTDLVSSEGGALLMMINLPYDFDPQSTDQDLQALAEHAAYSYANLGSFMLPDGDPDRISPLKNYLDLGLYPSFASEADFKQRMSRTKTLQEVSEHSQIGLLLSQIMIWGSPED